MSCAPAASPAKRGSYSKTYSKQGILDALQEYKQQLSLGQRPSFSKIGQRHNIPSSTLHDYYVRSQSAIASSPRYSAPNEVTASLVLSTRPGGNNRHLTDEVEHKLKEWIDACGDVLSPSVDLIRLKAQRLYFATHNTPVTSENEQQLASLKWWRCFKKRYPTLSVRRTQPHSFVRARATQPEIINHFYDLLKQQLDAHQFEPNQIYAADETGVAGDLKTPKGVGDKGAFKHIHFHTRSAKAGFEALHQTQMIYYFFTVQENLSNKSSSLCVAMCLSCT